MRSRFRSIHLLKKRHAASGGRQLLPAASSIEQAFDEADYLGVEIDIAKAADLRLLENRFRKTNMNQNQEHAGIGVFLAFTGLYANPNPLDFMKSLFFTAEILNLFPLFLILELRRNEV